MRVVHWCRWKGPFLICSCIEYMDLCGWNLICFTVIPLVSALQGGEWSKRSRHCFALHSRVTHVWTTGFWLEIDFEHIRLFHEKHFCLALHFRSSYYIAKVVVNLSARNRNLRDACRFYSANDVHSLEINALTPNLEETSKVISDL